MKTVTLAAFRADAPGSPELGVRLDNGTSLVGILPLVAIKSLSLSKEYISMPFLDTGGVVAVDKPAADALMRAAMELTKESNAKRIEFRQFTQASTDDIQSGLDSLVHNGDQYAQFHSQTMRHKVRMVLELHDSADALMKSFKSKLRSQVKKPIRDGVTVKIGDIELLQDFYQVFCINMRDLGSPVHSKKYLASVVASLSGSARILVAYHDGIPLAGSIVVGYEDTLYNPWASSLKAYKRLNANMLLYWTMLEYGCNNGYRYFDFGRSTPNEGTYRFKAQWGATAHPLEWIILQKGLKKAEPSENEKSSFSLAIQCWQRLPVGLTRWLGPKIRKHISL